MRSAVACRYWRRGASAGHMNPRPVVDDVCLAHAALTSQSEMPMVDIVTLWSPRLIQALAGRDNPETWPARFRWGVFFLVWIQEDTWCRRHDLGSTENRGHRYLSTSAHVDMSRVPNTVPRMPPWQIADVTQWLLSGGFRNRC